ncbi:MAG: SCO family protein [Microthrixaceae bacterium]
MSATSDTEAQPSHEPAPGDRHNARVRSVAILVLVVAVVIGSLALLVSSGSTDSGADPGAGSSESNGWAGRILVEPESKPPIELTDTNGDPYDLQAATDGRLALLMFGYTNCPDVCPINLGTLSAAIEEMDPAVGNSIDMVFVTADPQRDTPETIREYLDGYNRGFTGLWGAPEQVLAAQQMANVPPAVREEVREDGGYNVGHATQIIAYSADGIARIVYPFGTRQADWTRDLPRLVAGEIPEA